MKIAVLGSAGMLGKRVLFRLLEVPKYTVHGYARERHDLREANTISKIAAENYDVLVNCAGITKIGVDTANDMVAVNHILPHSLRRKIDSKIIHISTDCVFDGKKGSYTVLDQPSPVDWYGSTKANGENPQNLTIRTSFIGWDSRKHAGLLEWLFANREGSVEGYTNVLWSGLTADEVAKAILHVVDSPLTSGLFHLHGPVLSKWTILNLLNDALRLNVSIRPVDVPEIDRSLVGQEAFSETFGYSPPSWVEMLEQLRSETPE